MVNQQFNDSERRNPIISLFQSNTAKIIMVCMLTLGLLIPLEFVKDLIRERAARKHGTGSKSNVGFRSKVLWSCLENSLQFLPDHDGDR